MKKFILLISLLIILSSSGVFAADFNLYTDISDSYFAGRDGYVKVTIYNSYFTDDWFEISTVGTPSDWVKPVVSAAIIPGSSNGTVLVLVHPSSDAIPIAYNYILKVTRSSSRSSIEIPLVINVRQVTDAVISDFKLSCSSCNGTVTASGSVENVGTQPLDLTVYLKTADQQRTVNIGNVNPFGFKTFSESFDLSKYVPSSYNMEASVVDSSGNVLYKDSKLYEIPALRNIVYDRQVSSSPFGAFITITATNEGNVQDVAQIHSDVDKSWYTLFSGPNPTSTIGGAYIWSASLAPSQSTKLSYSEIYWPTYLLIILLVAGGAFAYLKLVAVDVKKAVIGSFSVSKGNEVSVSLSIKNRRRQMSKVIVRDVVPHHFSIISSFATVKPLIRKIAEGTELIWRIGDIKAHEERVLQYNIRAIKDIVGRVHLPSAHVRAEYEGKPLSKRSNSLALEGTVPAGTVIPVEVE